MPFSSFWELLFFLPGVGHLVVKGWQTIGSLGGTSQFSIGQRADQNLLRVQEMVVKIVAPELIFKGFKRGTRIFIRELSFFTGCFHYLCEEGVPLFHRGGDQNFSP